MSYSTNLLTVASDVLYLKTEAEKQKDDLLFKITAINRQKSDIADNSLTVQVNLSAARQKYEMHKSLYDSLPPEVDKKEEKYNLAKYQFELAKAEERSETKGPMAVIQMEHEVDQINARIASIDAYIAELDARLAVLAAA